MIKEKDPRIAAIRTHKLVGRNSCTVIDECWSDEEILAELNDSDIISAKGAIKWAVEMCDIFIEQSMNCRWGEDSDPEVAQQKEWEEDKKLLL